MGQLRIVPSVMAGSESQIVDKFSQLGTVHQVGNYSLDIIIIIVVV